jgi:Domain of unknown function (DUF2019)
MIQETGALLEAYRVTALAWDGAQRDAKRANPLFDQLHELFKQLRTEESGREGILAMTGDPNVGVRLMAAGHSLGWAPTEAVRVLESIAAGTGLHAVTAKYTLKAFREGTLNQDW